MDVKNSDRRIYYRFIKTKQKARGIILITHGYRAHGSAHKGFIRALIARGYHVVIWDMPSHGRSFGPPGYIEKIKTCVDAMLFVLVKTIRTEKKLPVYLISHSTGFSVTVDTLVTLLKKRKTRILSRIHCISGIDPAFYVLHNVNFILRWTAPIAPLFLHLKYFKKLNVASWRPEHITDDETVVQWMQKNLYFYRGPLLLQTAYQIHRSGIRSLRMLKKIPFPIYISYGSEDVVSLQVSEDEFKKRKLWHVTTETLVGFKHNPLDGEQAKKHVWDKILHWIEKTEATHVH